ncbi:uncharacterized protein CLUP02_01523 [Colletotrichum lupini]|uniref:Uncharacterized protein n=1 Tax=Colletotrichum lupini TaxID=145971 RepID=A0A9Q8W9D4_9PEZI|nr:uncharacterized protein CLUP02_01523 [Colletotrichum lupini]UQC74871.1 hypothetical protein CLUP02_01523 [Colletotrichum lupini]
MEQYKRFEYPPTRREAGKGSLFNGHDFDVYENEEWPERLSFFEAALLTRCLFVDEAKLISCFETRNVTAHEDVAEISFWQGQCKGSRRSGSHHTSLFVTEPPFRRKGRLSFYWQGAACLQGWAMRVCMQLLTAAASQGAGPSVAFRDSASKVKVMIAEWMGQTRPPNVIALEKKGLPVVGPSDLSNITDHEDNATGDVGQNGPEDIVSVNIRTESIVTPEEGWQLGVVDRKETISEWCFEVVPEGKKFAPAPPTGPFLPQKYHLPRSHSRRSPSPPTGVPSVFPGELPGEALTRPRFAATTASSNFTLLHHTLIQLCLTLGFS